MKTSEKIIKRLYDMGAINSLECNVYLHRGSRNGSFSWAISCGARDIGSTESMKECLSWERWIYSPQLYEIFPYIEGKTTVFHGDIVEEKHVKY